MTHSWVSEAHRTNVTQHLQSCAGIPAQSAQGRSGADHAGETWRSGDGSHCGHQARKVQELETKAQLFSSRKLVVRDELKKACLSVLLGRQHRSCGETVFPDGVGSSGGITGGG